MGWVEVEAFIDPFRLKYLEDEEETRKATVKGSFPHI
jgi:hypothetical protein